MKLLYIVDHFSKWWFTTHSDWPRHPASEFACPNCGAKSPVTLADLDAARFRPLTSETSSLLDKLSEHRYWAEAPNYLLLFGCSGCGRRIALRYAVRKTLHSGLEYDLVIAGLVDE